MRDLTEDYKRVRSTKERVELGSVHHVSRRAQI